MVCFVTKFFYRSGKIAMIFSDLFLNNEKTQFLLHDEFRYKG